MGRNNTGKSAFIEAASLASAAYAGWYDANGGDLLEGIIENRGGWEYADLMIRMGAANAEIVSEGENATTVRIVKELSKLPENARSSLTRSIDSVIDETYHEEMDRLIKPKKYEARRSEIMIRDLERKIMRARRDSLRQPKVFIANVNEEKRDGEAAAVFGTSSEAIIESDYYEFVPEEMIIRSVAKKESNTVFPLFPSYVTFEQFFRRLTRTGRVASLIEDLRERIDYFKDIREVEDDFLVSLKYRTKPVPIQSMGDGFSSILALLTAVWIAKGGIVFMEEPETSLHPGFMKILMDHIVNSANRDKVQYIISTHSSDFLDLLSEIPSELFSVIRLQGIEGTAQIDYSVLSGSEAIEELKELKMDLRGP